MRIFCVVCVVRPWNRGLLFWMDQCIPIHSIAACSQLTTFQKLLTALHIVWGQLLLSFSPPIAIAHISIGLLIPYFLLSRYLCPQQWNIHSRCCIMLLRSWDFLGLGHLAPICCTGHWGDLQLAHRQGGVSMVSKLLDVKNTKHPSSKSLGWGGSIRFQVFIQHNIYI